MEYETLLFLTVIAGLTRNTLRRKGTPSRMGDGGCSSAMTVKGSVVVNPCQMSKASLV